ncbi:MAG: response regulator [Arcticibacter sp.]
MDRLKLLIVDDKQENIVALEALLDRNDIEIVSTTSPNEALKICWEQDISIALVDVQMPEMDGFELVEILKGNPRTKEILVIFVTAISMEVKYAVRGLSVGAVDYLFKPLDPYVTSAKVDSFVQLVSSQRAIKQKNEELRKYQQELIAAKEEAEQGRKVKETFLANMSHEIRTPINGMQGIVHLLENTQLDAEQAKMVNLLKISTDSLLGVINDVLDISKIESGKFRIVRTEGSIRNLVNSVAGLLQFRAQERGIKLVVDIDQAVPSVVLVDGLRLNQILLNLVGNAIKFTEKGSVTLRVRVSKAQGHLAEIQFVVQDTGIGIERDRFDRIFETFEQATSDTAHQYGGTGLGLAIVKKLAELKGGEITLESESGKGTTFTFTNWYQVVGAPVEKPVESIGELPSLRGTRILVAEDNTINQFMIRKVLQRWDVEVDIVENGAQAFEKLQNDHYDLVLMDTNMPVMGGYEAIEKIRKELPEEMRSVPVITLSAAVLDEDQKKAMEVGANDVVAKPFDLSVLHHKITKWAKYGDKKV